jgi:galactose mutarotase-like enzyme
MKKSIILLNEEIEVKINLLGGELEYLGKIHHNNLLWFKNEEFWNRVSPNLFPIVGKLKNDSFQYKKKTYLMKQHGFARDLEFEVVKQTNNSVELSLRDNEKTRQQYPFSFCFSILYELVGKIIYISYKTINMGDEVLPYSVGGHPGFDINLPIENYKLNFYESFISERWIIEDGLYSGKTEKMKIDGTLNLKSEFFMLDALVFKAPSFSKVTLENSSLGKIITLGSNNWEAIGFWTKQGAPFLCIEPWWGWADNQKTNGNLFQKSGMHFLETGESEIVSYYIEVH